ncbi:neuraminidase-like domain-containing protein [Candidatus Nitrotoga sp. 1052]|uniref:neuraminidase-like domain-containing protein n=1 Tax=Candidatus Nitrotoga sp. 1052 TaxID=2886964 RepID=UPI001EF54693|nr:neuraminidase-like domain-containing protein [Candidatus Nitrotoga sp. 1052]CAH1073230.1 PA14 domain-containing protein [Candidatus Nitrotoga sp. 1052]
MNKITFSLNDRMTGAVVADLQDALQQILERGVILRDDEGTRRELAAALQRERAEQTYGSATRKLVGIFQESRQIQADGAVDEPTANAINAFLREAGLLDRADAPKSYIVSGQVRREDGLPLQGVQSRAFHESDRGGIRLGDDVTDAAGRYTIRYELLRGVDGINLRVSLMDDDGELLQSSEVIRNAKPLEIMDLTLPMDRKPATQRRLEGQIMLQHGMPAEQLKLRLYRLDYGGNATLLNETSTLAGGQYAFTYDPGGRAVSLEVRAVNGANEEKLLSKPLNDLSGESRAVLNLVAPGALQPLAAEYRRLAADLTPHVGQMIKLAEAKENNERQDLTVLNRVTGWDARLIALAATTERLSADADVQLPQEFVYGLLRAGLPFDKLMLAQVEPDVAEQALKAVRDAGIVELSDQQIGNFKKQFATFATTVRLNVPAPGSRSTYGELLKASGLSADAQTKFAPVYLRHRGDASQLWDEARKAGLDDEQVAKLQLQGKLIFLTGNSESMTARLIEKQIYGPEQLVEQGLYRAELWVTEVLGQAGIPLKRRNNLMDADRKKLDAVIPPAYAGEKIESRLNAYAEDMARKVRLSYPTQVVGRLIEEDEIKLPTARDATVTLLKAATAQGFRLGETPVAAFLKSHAGMQAGMSNAEFQAAGQQLKVLQRVYQITHSNEAMPILISLGMTSAYDVMAYSESEFTALYERKYFDLYGRSPTRTESRLVYRKAKQVSVVTYNLFTIAKKLDSEPAVAGMSASAEVRENVRNELIKHFPTMEALFGSLDFCECEHCRSVLSPAAYLVDLLQFVDTEPGVWSNFLAQWKATHHNQEYPHKDKHGNPVKPYDVLQERRPDLPYIALDCQNTQTALPYIDVVNEILEYYVANGKLEKEAGHDTGEATTAELLAEPQNVIREAYDTLREARYPLTLPFDLWIETVRQFCNFFETPLARVLEVLLPNDGLFAPTQSLDRFTIFMESLGFSLGETAIFIDIDPLAKWHELYGFMTAAEAVTVATDPNTKQRIDLNSAKALSRRLGVSYKEIAEIVQTGFVNPKLAKLGVLYKLGASIHDARFYLAHKNDPAPVSIEDNKRRLEVDAFTEEMQVLALAFNVSTAQLEAELQAIPFDGVLVLADPDAGCNFDLTTLQYADGTKADPIAFLRINLFVRLWRKLGWSIEEVDRALCTFVPKEVPFDDDPINLGKQPLRTALIYLSHLKALDEKVRVGKQSRIKLITLWSNIATTGSMPLYTQLFLTRSVLKSTSVFDHPLGRYMSVAGIKLKDHVLALRGALGLTADEISRILVDAAIPLETAELSLPNVSLLYRYGLLAKALKLLVSELIALKQLSGLDPFTQLHPEPLADATVGVEPLKKAIEYDYPFSQTLRFVEVAEEVKKSGLKIEDLEYLLRHRFDETGKYHPNSDATLALLKMISEGIRVIRAEHTVPDDSGAMSEEMLRQKLGLALPSDVVERFLAMMNNTAEFTATKSPVAEADQLHATNFIGELAISQVDYNSSRQEQKLVFRGVLFDRQKADLKAKFNVTLAAGQQLTFTDLLEEVQVQAKQQANKFFIKHLEKHALNPSVTTGFMDLADFDLLFDPNLALAAGETEQDRVRKKRTKLANAFLPFLQTRLIRQFIVQTMTAQTAADPGLVESLLTDERLIAIAGSKNLLTALASTSERSVTATFFDGAETALTTLSLADADTSSQDKDGNPLKPATAEGALLAGYLEVPTAGAYRFSIELDKQHTEAELRFPDMPEPVFLKGKAAGDHAMLGNQPKEFLELKAGVLYRFALNLKKLNGGEARLRVQGETLPKGPLSQLTLYPIAAINAAERAALLLNKALQLVQSLSLSEREIRYILSHAADFDGVSLSELPTETAGDTQAEKTAATERFARFLRLAAYARLKDDLAGGTDAIIGIFEANETADADRLDKKVYPLVSKLTRRDEATVKASAQELVAVPSFQNEKPLQRLWEALQVAERFSVPVASLSQWTRIASSAATSAQRFVIASDVKEAIKARFEPETWQRLAQPIFDKLRQRQRDALVAHVMHQHGFARMEQLYEYFLIDPGMEPVVQTSRIRLATASVQLFIQRCLLNMELLVHPSVINSKQWEWMKRYRVWEANRKIFLFPENWLEPEFRDDKTHLFSEMEGALLQGDISRDLVEDAFFNYLKKLDELARLDIVAMHLEDNANPAGRCLHVIGRTYSEPHKYFYRQYAQQMWTPWEPVSAEIEGDHLAPVVWRDRLYLFWVTFMEKSAENAQPGSLQGSLAQAGLADMMRAVKVAGEPKQIDVQLHWSEYLNGKWSTRESSGFNAPSPIVKVGVLSFDSKSVFVHVSKAYENGEERGVYIHLGGAINQAFHLAGRNSTPEKDSYATKPDNPYNSANMGLANRYSGNSEFKVSFQERITTGTVNTTQNANLNILQQGGAYTLLPCDNNLMALGVSEEGYINPAVAKAAIESGIGEIASLMKPVFYQDNAHTFFVEPNVTERTIEEWQEWVMLPPRYEQPWLDPDWWKKNVVIPKIPNKGPTPDPGEPRGGFRINQRSLIQPIPSRDWLVNSGTGLMFDGSLIGPRGQPGLQILLSGGVGKEGVPINVNPGSGLTSGSTVVLTGGATLEQSGLTQVGGGLNIVGGGGFNSALAQNLNEWNRSDFGTGMPDVGRLER